MSLQMYRRLITPRILHLRISQHRSRDLRIMDHMYVFSNFVIYLPMLPKSLKTTITHAIPLYQTSAAPTASGSPSKPTSPSSPPACPPSAASCTANSKRAPATPPPRTARTSTCGSGPSRWVGPRMGRARRWYRLMRTRDVGFRSGMWRLLRVGWGRGMGMRGRLGVEWG